MNAKISVIIPVYKVEPYLRQCLDSVVNQTYKNLEIILIDDGSPDNCGKICDEYAVIDSRVIVIHKENGGLSAARNDGIAKATGYWITFVDSDDWCELDYYEKIISQICDNTSDVICAGGHIIELQSENKVVYSIENTFCFCDSNSKEKLQTMVLALKNGYASLAAPWDKLYRTDFIRKKGLLFDLLSEAWEDIWFNFQIFQKAEKVEGHYAIGYHYRIRPMSITQSFNPKRPQINYDFVCNLQDYAKKNKVSDSIYKAIHARTISLIKNTLDLYYFNPKNDKAVHEVLVELKQMTIWPYYFEAINEKNNPYISRRQKLLKWLLQLPSMWPLKISYKVENWLGEK